MTEIKRKIAFKTLGCRLNQFETGSLATQFKNAGYELVNFTEEADVYIINTCTVTNQSDHKSRNIINQASRRGFDPLLVVTGCMAESSRDKLLEDNNINYVIGNNNKSEVFSVVDAHFKGEIYPLDDTRKVFEFQNPEKIFKTRGTIKIQDGCDNYCTFCIIPFVRGRAISRPLPEIIENARKLIENGYHEIVVTGVNIGRYKYGKYKFEDVIEKMLELPGNFRLRISSMEPEGIGEKFINLISHPKMCPHLHLCLQSGADPILVKMRRMYDSRKYFDLINQIRKVRPDFNFTTDILVGFPGETEEDFEKTLHIIEQIRFGHIHTFKYSLRDGTRAAKMEHHIPEKIKNERSSLIRELSEKHKRIYYQNMINHDQIVLVEGKSQLGLLKGYGQHYIPVMFHADTRIIDTFQHIRIKGIGQGKEMYLTGELVQSGKL